MISHPSHSLDRGQHRVVTGFQHNWHWPKSVHNRLQNKNYHNCDKLSCFHIKCRRISYFGISIIEKNIFEYRSNLKWLNGWKIGNLCHKRVVAAIVATVTAAIAVIATVTATIAAISPCSIAAIVWIPKYVFILKYLYIF